MNIFNMTNVVEEKCFIFLVEDAEGAREVFAYAYNETEAREQLAPSGYHNIQLKSVV